MPDFTIALAIGLVIGFILGYGIRAERLSPIGATDAKTTEPSMLDGTSCGSSAGTKGWATCPARRAQAVR